MHGPSFEQTINIILYFSHIFPLGEKVAFRYFEQTWTSFNFQVCAKFG